MDGADAAVATDAVHDFLAELTPGDTGREVVDGLVVRFEGFTDLCQEDAEARTKLPASDPRHLASYGAVYDEVLSQWSIDEGREPDETGFAGPETHPTIWAAWRAADAV